jgi:6-phosphogluconolactonase (cycloisomerase 2 family)
MKRNSFLLLFTLSLVVFASNCETIPKNPKANTLVVTPSATTMLISTSQTVTATSYDSNGNPTNDSIGLTPNLSESDGTAIPCGAAPGPGVQCGSISPVSVTSNSLSGATFTAPPTVPISTGTNSVPNVILIQGTDCTLANANCSVPLIGSANIKITSNVTVSVSLQTSPIIPGSTTPTSFTATVTNDPNALGVTWSLSQGTTACTVTVCGSLTTTNKFTTAYIPPATAPTSPLITLTATSVTDFNKTGTTTINLSPNAISVSLSATSATVQAGGTPAITNQTFTANILNDTKGSNAVNWTLSQGATPCSTTSNVVCGSVSPTSSVSGTAVTYTAPPTAASQSTVTLTATSQTDNTKSAAATITINPSITVSVAPVSPTVQTGALQQFLATLTNDPVAANGVTWALSQTGAACSPACGILSAATPPSTTTIEFISPAAVPSPATVTLTAKSVTDGTISGVATITVTSPPSTQTIFPRFLYTSNTGRITMHTINASTGQIRFNGYLPVGGTDSISGAVSVTNSSGSFVYAVDPVASEIFAYSVGANGTLSPVTTPLSVPGFSPLTSLWTIAATSGVTTTNFVYALTSTGYDALTVGSNGALTKSANGTFAQTFTQMAFDPAGQFAYLAAGGIITQYAIDPVAGTLMNATNFNITGAPNGNLTAQSNPIAVSPNGKNIYIAYGVINSESLYTASISAGVLTGIPAATVLIGGTFPASLAIDNTGAFLYVTYPGVQTMTIPPPGSIGVFKLASNGTPTLSETVATPPNPVQLAIDPSNNYLYAASKGQISPPPVQQPEIQVFPLQLSGTGLATTPSSVISENASTLVIVAGSQAVTYSPQFAYVSGEGNENIAGFSVDATSGNLTSLGTPFSTGASPSQPTSITSDPFGRFVFNTNAFNSATGSISPFVIQAGSTPPGLLSAASAPVSFGSQPFSVVVDGSGSFAYVSDRANAAIFGFTIASPAGTLTAITHPSSDSFGGPAGQAVSPYGSTLFTVDFEANSIFESTIGNTGLLTSENSTTGTSLITPNGVSPVAVAVDPSNRFVYVVCQGNNLVIGYAFTDTASGNNATLTLLSGTGATATTGNTPTAIAIEPTGHFLYVTNSGDNTISAFSINQTTGLLTPLGAAISVPVTVAGGIPQIPAPNVAAVFADPSGKFLYVVNNNEASTPIAGTVTGFLINSDGSLSAMTPVQVFNATYGSNGIVITTKIQ